MHCLLKYTLMSSHKIWSVYLSLQWNSCLLHTAKLEYLSVYDRWSAARLLYNHNGKKNWNGLPAILQRINSSCDNAQCLSLFCIPVRYPDLFYTQTIQINEITFHICIPTVKDLGTWHQYSTQLRIISDYWNISILDHFWHCSIVCTICILSPPQLFSPLWKNWQIAFQFLWPCILINHVRRSPYNPQGYPRLTINYAGSPQAASVARKQNRP